MQFIFDVKNSVIDITTQIAFVLSRGDAISKSYTLIFQIEICFI